MLLGGPMKRSFLPSSILFSLVLAACQGDPPDQVRCADGTFAPAGLPPGTCHAWTTCPSGTFVTSQPTATSDRACGACPSGTFSSDADATACTAQPTCAPGTFVDDPGSATTSRLCTPCPSDTFSNGADATTCTAQPTCAPGTFVDDPGSAATSRLCTPCPSDTFSSDADASACTAQPICAPGTFVDDPGTATTPRHCTPCPSGTFSSDANALACAAWTVCTSDRIEGRPGSATRDRRCDLAEWTAFLASSGDDRPIPLALDDDGGVYVGGYTNGTLPGATSAGGLDGFVVHLDGDGAIGWTDQFGTATSDYCDGLARAPDGRLSIVGETTGALGGPVLGSLDMYLRQYPGDAASDTTLQLGTNTQDVSGTIVADADGNLYHVGQVRAAIGGQTAIGDADAVLQKRAPDGTLLWTRLFGTAGYDHATSVAITSDGHVVVSGYVTGALPAQTALGGSDSFVRAYDPDGNELWTDQHGTSATDFGIDVATDAAGNTYFLGRTEGTYPSETSAGSTDVVVRAYDADGNVLWTTQLGTSAVENAMAIAARPDGYLYVASDTRGAFPMQTYAGGNADACLIELDASGVLTRVRQFGTSADDVTGDVAYDPRGRVLLSGASWGALDGHVVVGGGDGYVRSLRP